MVNPAAGNDTIAAHQMAYEAIKEEILSLRLPPTARLNAIDLAAQVGLSRTPVREALARLEQEGLAVREAAGGFRVHSLSLKEIVDVYRVRAALEVEAAIEALPNLTPDALALMASTLEGSRAYLAPETFNEFILANRGFHAQIVELSGNAMLKRFMAPIADRVRLIGAMLIRRHAARTAEVLAENLAILDALRSGDARVVEAAVRLHVQRAADHATTLLAASPGKLTIAA